MKFALPILLAVLGMIGCTADRSVRIAGDVCALIRLAEMPLESHDDMPFVRATIGGAPVLLLVDTGAERTLFTEAAVKRLHLPRDFEHATRTSGIGSPVATWDARLPDGLILGGTRFRIDSITVGNFAMMDVAGTSADGLLGADILFAFDIDLDLPAHRLSFYRARSNCPQATPPWTEAYMSVAGITAEHDRLLMPFELDGVRGTGVLDTGAQMSSISQRMLVRLGLHDDALATDRTVMARGAGPDQVPLRIHQFREFRVGPAVLQWPVLPVVPMTIGMGDALIGADFLQGRRAWLSFATHRVFITPLERGPPIAATQPLR